MNTETKATKTTCGDHRCMMDLSKLESLEVIKKVVGWKELGIADKVSEHDAFLLSRGICGKLNRITGQRFFLIDVAIAMVKEGA